MAYVSKSKTHSRESVFSVLQLSVFVITSTRDNLGAFVDRMQEWSTGVLGFPSTAVDSINKAAWAHRAIIHTPNVDLSHAQLAHFDSHWRLWKHVYERNAARAVIMEDVVALSPVPEMAQEIECAVREADAVFPGWHVLFLGHCAENEPEAPSTHVCKATDAQDMFFYVLSREGARILYTHGRPYALPLGDRVAWLVDQGKLVALKAVPAVCGRLGFN